jgi:hypothetical protein
MTIFSANKQAGTLLKQMDHPIILGEHVYLPLQDTADFTLTRMYVFVTIKR